MSINQESLNEIIELSKSDISDLIIDDMKFGEMFDNFHNQKKSSLLKLDSIKPKKAINILLSIKKPVSKETIKEESFSKEEEDEEEGNIIYNENDIKNNSSKKLFLSLDKKRLINIKTAEDESILDFSLKNCESSKEKSKEFIDKIIEFIDIEENDFQKYLLENKIIEEEKENNSSLQDQEEDLDFEAIYEENEDIDDKNEILEENKNEGEKDKKSDINKDKYLDDSNIINKDKDNSNNPEINDNINNYDGTKLNLIEKTENFSFLKEKDKSELIRYLNNNPKKDLDSQETPEKYMIYYEIFESIKKEQLSKEFNDLKITCLFIDDNYIYVGDGAGNLLIYSIKPEKQLKMLPNPFHIENNKKLNILSIDSDESYIIAGYERGKLVIYAKNPQNVQKIKTFEVLNDITKEDIIEVKIYSKLNNEIIIYFADNKENVHKIEIIKNKIFKNKIYEKKLIAELKNAKKLEPYYQIEINPFNYNCIGVVNNTAVNIYMVNKFDKSPIFTFPKEDQNAFLSLCFSPKKSEKNKFYISYLKLIYMCELEDDYNGSATLNRIVLEDNIVKIGFFKDEFIYAYTEKNKIKLISFNENKKENDGTYQFIDTIEIDNNDIDKNNNDNTSFIINFKNYISINNGKLFLYYKNKIFYYEILPCIIGLNKLYNKTMMINDEHIWDVLFKLIIEIKNNKHSIWEITDSKKFYESVFNYIQSYLSLLIIQLNEKKSSEEIKRTTKRFNQLMQHLIDIEFYDFMLNDKKGLYPMLFEIKLNDFYFFLLEPLIIEDNFINIEGIKKSFILNLMKSFLNKENKYIALSKSWLSEILMHLPLKNITQIEKEIIEKYLVNVLLYLIINNELDLTNSYFIDYFTPINIMMQLLRDKLTNIDLDKKELFVKENRYKDDIVLSNDYLRLKLIWYIVYILKNEILNEKENKKKAILKTVFVKEILKILTDEDKLYFIVFNELDKKPQNENSYKLMKEIIYVYQLVLDNLDNLSTFYEINRDTFFQNMKTKLEKREEFQVYLKIFIIKNILKENLTDIANDEKLNLVFYFMENLSQLLNEYPEIKEVEFENNLIEILKLTDSITYKDSERLLKLVHKCKDSYKQLGEYILLNFNKK